MANTELKSDHLFEMLKIHLSTDAGKEITKKIGLVYQINIAPKKIGVDEVSYIVDLKKGEVTKALLIVMMEEFASLLSGCSQLGYLQFGKKLHSFVLRNNLEVEDFIGTALIDMYIKCGSIELAERVFKSIKEPCLATWNTIITGYGICGFGNKALTLYAELRERGLKPDKITFLGVLSACIHGGNVDEGRRYFQIMTEEFGMEPSLQHCASMVALLSRAGFFEEALLFIRNMDFDPDSAVWGALISACCIHQEVKLGEYLAKKLYLLDHRNGGLYVLMSNLYASKGMWDDVSRVRQMMKDTGGDGCSGASLIELTSFKEMDNNS